MVRSLQSFLMKYAIENHLLYRLQLEYMYENTLCSCCRESIVKEMGSRYMLTDRILEECLYDSNEEIREYVRSIIKT